MILMANKNSGKILRPIADTFTTIVALLPAFLTFALDAAASIVEVAAGVLGKLATLLDKARVYLDEAFGD